MQTRFKYLDIMAEAMNVLADESGEVLKRNKAQLDKGFSKNLKKLKNMLTIFP